MIGAYKVCPNPQCGAQNKPEARFCKNCGAPLEDVPVVAPTLSDQESVGWKKGRKKSIESLGRRIDGWADIIQDGGEKAEEIAKTFRECLSNWDMPGVTLEVVDMGTSGTSEKRPYLLAYNRMGATVAVYIGKFGKNLYVAWDLFMRPVWNWAILLGFLIMSALIGLAVSPRNLTGWIAITVSSTLSLVILSMVVSKTIKGDALAFFRRELTFFDADDIAAMMLSVHKALKYAIDAVGLDVQLRIKEQFRAARRDRII